MNSYRSVTVSLSICACMLAWTAQVVANNKHSRPVKNTTGQTADDLHVTVDYNLNGTKPTVTGGTFPPSTDATNGGKTFNFTTTGAGVPDKGSVTVNWETQANSVMSDNIAIGSSYWTQGGEKLQDGFEVSSADLNSTYTDMGSGQFAIAVVNTGAPIAYSGLQIVTGADGSYDTLDDYLNGMATGTPATLLVPSSGTFASGTTQVAVITRSSSNGVYDAGQVLIEGQTWGEGATAPEPSAGALAVAGLALLVRRRCRSSL